MARKKSRVGQFRRSIRQKYGYTVANKTERCVEHVKASGRNVNPFAVCTSRVAKREG